MRVNRTPVALLHSKAIPVRKIRVGAMELNDSTSPVSPTESNGQKVVATASAKGQLPQVFCDLDGVLCDFDKSAIAIMGCRPGTTSRSVMWNCLAKADGFCKYPRRGNVVHGGMDNPPNCIGNPPR